MLATIAGSGVAVDTNRIVLIVEDDELVLESIDLHLSASDGYQTIRVQGASGALSHMQTTPRIDVIVADVILAGTISGIELCRKSIEHHPAITIVVITADPEVSTPVPARGVFLRKPFGGEQLLEGHRHGAGKRRHWHRCSRRTRTWRPNPWLHAKTPRMAARKSRLGQPGAGLITGAADDDPAASPRTRRWARRSATACCGACCDDAADDRDPGDQRRHRAVTGRGLMDGMRKRYPRALVYALVLPSSSPT